MAVAQLLKDKPKPSDADIDSTITNICRCGTFVQVRAAIHRRRERVRGGRHELHSEDESSHVCGERGGRRCGLALGLELPLVDRSRSWRRTARPRSMPGW